MPAIHPDAELAPRDVVARAIALRRLGGSACAARCDTGVRHRHPLPRSRGHRPQRPASIPRVTPCRSRPPRTSTWAGSRPTRTARPACPGSGPAAKWPRPDCTAATGSRAIRSWKVSCSARASRTPCARRSCRRPPARSTCRGARPPAAAEPARILALRQLVGRSLGPVRNGADMSEAMAELAEPDRLPRATRKTLQTIARLLLGCRARAPRVARRALSAGLSGAVGQPAPCADSSSRSPRRPLRSGPRRAALREAGRAPRRDGPRRTGGAR